MSEAGTTPAWRQRHNLVLVGAAAAAAIAGGFIGRGFVPAQTASNGQRTRPIIQLVRPQSSLPSLADNVNRLCPSVAAIVPHGYDSAHPPAAKTGKTTATSAKAALLPPPPPQGFLISADGWIIFAGTVPGAGPLDALFGDGRRVPISDLRSDPVSGLSVARTGASGSDVTPITLSDQSFPRIGDFGFALQSPNGTGCSRTAIRCRRDRRSSRSMGR